MSSQIPEIQLEDSHKEYLETLSIYSCRDKLYAYMTVAI